MAVNRAVFLDKDGTVIEDVPYNVEPERIRWMPGAVDGLRMLRSAGYRLVIVSNQSGVARGLFPEEALAGVERRLAFLFANAGLALDGFYYCPHHPQGTVARYAMRCECRKPAPGLVLRAARELKIDLSGSWVIGDILDDVEAGRQAGCRTILIDTGHETERVMSYVRRPDYTVSNLVEAARVVLPLGEPIGQA